MRQLIAIAMGLVFGNILDVRGDLDHFGVIAVFVFVLVENFGLPIPGETMLVTAAVYARATGHVNIFLVALCCIAGVWSGATLSYLAGRKGGVPLMTRLHVPERHLARAETYMTRWGPYTVVLGRYVAFLRSYIGWLAGINRMKAAPFFLWNLIGATLWTVTFTVIGYVVGDNLGRLWGFLKPLGGVGIAIAVIAVAAVLALLVARHRRAERKLDEPLTPPGPTRTTDTAEGATVMGKDQHEDIVAATASTSASTRIAPARKTGG